MALDEPTRSGPPAAYFPEPGSWVVVGIVDVGDFHQRIYETNELKYWPDGNPVKGKVVTGYVMSDNGAAKGNREVNEPVQAGDVITFWCEGGKHFTWRDALNAHGPVDRGDVMLWKREADEPSKSVRGGSRKVYSAKLRKPEAKDGDIVNRCIAAHRELTRTAPLDTPVAAASAEVPF